MLKRAYTYASPLLHRLIRLARIEQAACDDSVLEIRGWAIWLGSASPRLVRIYLNDTLVGETRLNRSRPDLWWRYTELGGNRPRAALVEYLAGTTAWTASEHNTLAQALNEDPWELGHPSLAPYRELVGDRALGDFGDRGTR